MKTKCFPILYLFLNILNSLENAFLTWDTHLHLKSHFVSRFSKRRILTYQISWEMWNERKGSNKLRFDLGEMTTDGNTWRYIFNWNMFVERDQTWKISRLFIKFSFEVGIFNIISKSSFLMGGEHIYEDCFWDSASRPLCSWCLLNFVRHSDIQSHVTSVVAR